MKHFYVCKVSTECWNVVFDARGCYNFLQDSHSCKQWWSNVMHFCNDGFGGQWHTKRTMVMVGGRAIKTS